MEHRITETPNPETITTSVTFPRDLWNAVKIEAIKRGTSAQQLCADTLRDMLSQSAESPAATAKTEPKSTREAKNKESIDDIDKRKSA